MSVALPADHAASDDQPATVGEARPTCVAKAMSSPGGRPVSPSDRLRPPTSLRSLPVDPMAFLELRVLAESFHDTQQNRIGCVNRMERGGVAPDLFAGQIDALVAAEHSIELALVRRYRALVRSSLPGVDAWQKAEQGIGEKLLARLLGHLGHPAIAYPYHWEGTGADRKLLADEPFYRTKAQLRAYCGHGDPSRKRRKAMSADEAMTLGNPHCKMLVHLLAEATMKRTLPTTAPISISASEACADLSAPPNPPPSIRGATAVAEPSPDLAHEPYAVQTCSGDVRYSYRRLYEQRRELTVERVHVEPCVRCGPSGKPAAAGSPWSKAHQLADALRIVGKQILNDLWMAAS